MRLQFILFPELSKRDLLKKSCLTLKKEINLRLLRSLILSLQLVLWHL